MCCLNCKSKKTARGVPIFFLIKEPLTFLTCLTLILLIFIPNGYQKSVANALDLNARIFCYISLGVCALNTFANFFGLLAINRNNLKWLAPYVRFLLISLIIQVIVWALGVTKFAISMSQKYEWSSEFILLPLEFVVMVITAFNYCWIKSYHESVLLSSDQEAQESINGKSI